MKYGIILTESNYSELQTLKQRIREQAEQSEHKYSYAHIAIIGTPLFEKFKEDESNLIKWIPNYLSSRPDTLKNSSTVAECKIYYSFEFHVDARERSEGFHNFNYGSLVETDGEYFGFYRPQNKGAVFYLFDDPRDYHKVTWKWEEEHPAPNKVGTITDSKMLAWVDWLRERRHVYEVIMSDRNYKVMQFLESVSEAAAGCKSCNIGKERGYITKNNIRFVYTISDGYIHKELKIDNSYSCDALSAFVLMSEGKYDK